LGEMNRQCTILQGRAGNHSKALKHFMIAVGGGNNESLE
jgi:hypothetical protein